MYVNRQQPGGPIKRMVQPQLVPSGGGLNSRNEETQQAVNSDAVTTAAVAASAAVAATQPFLRVSLLCTILLFMWNYSSWFV